MKPSTQKAAVRRVRVPNVLRVAKHHGHLVVRHGGQEYVLVPLEQVERLEDERDLRAAKRALARIERGLEKTRPFDEVCRELGIR